jgi:hypothetical protein
MNFAFFRTARKECFSGSISFSVSLCIYYIKLIDIIQRYIFPEEIIGKIKEC